MPEFQHSKIIIFKRHWCIIFFCKLLGKKCFLVCLHQTYENYSDESVTLNTEKSNVSTNLLLQMLDNETRKCSNYIIFIIHCRLSFSSVYVQYNVYIVLFNIFSVSILCSSLQSESGILVIYNWNNLCRIFIFS